MRYALLEILRIRLCTHAIDFYVNTDLTKLEKTEYSMNKS